MDKIKTLNPAPLTDSLNNIRENALLFLREAEKLSPERRSRLIQFATRRCYLVVVSSRCAIRVSCYDPSTSVHRQSIGIL